MIIVSKLFLLLIALLICCHVSVDDYKKPQAWVSLVIAACFAGATFIY